MWKKVARRTGYSPKPKIETPRIMRARTGRTAQLVVPDDYVTGWDRFDVYSDGNGKIAFAENATGDYKIMRGNKGAGSPRLTIPSAYYDRFQYGTTEVTLTDDGGMWVLTT